MARLRGVRATEVGVYGMVERPARLQKISAAAAPSGFAIQNLAASRLEAILMYSAAALCGATNSIAAAKPSSTLLVPKRREDL